MQPGQQRQGQEEQARWADCLSQFSLLLQQLFKQMPEVEAMRIPLTMVALLWCLRK
jgi:hypothetical protein